MKKTIKSIITKDINDFSFSDIKQSLSGLSEEETAQLGQEGYPTKEVWCQLRDFLVERSLASNPNLPRDMTAYTPSETLKLMEKAPIKNWLDNVENLKIPVVGRLFSAGAFSSLTRRIVAFNLEDWAVQVFVVQLLDRQDNIRVEKVDQRFNHLGGDHHAVGRRLDFRYSDYRRL